MTRGEMAIFQGGGGSIHKKITNVSAATCRDVGTFWYNIISLVELVETVGEGGVGLFGVFKVLFQEKKLGVEEFFNLHFPDPHFSKDSDLDPDLQYPQESDSDAWIQWI